MGMKDKVTVALCLCTAVTVACTEFLTLPPVFTRTTSSLRLVDVLADLSPLLFLSAGVLIFFQPRLSYCLGLLAGLLALPWFVWTEFSLGEGSWASLNYVGAAPDDMQFATLAKLRLCLWR